MEMIWELPYSFNRGEQETAIVLRSLGFMTMVKCLLEREKKVGFPQQMPVSQKIKRHSMVMRTI